jgi:hypothetical protein
VTERPAWRSVWLTRVIALAISAVASSASAWFGLSVPLSYGLGAAYDPTATSQSRIAVGLAVVASISLAIGFVATIRTNGLREGEEGYSSYGALLSVGVCVFLLAGAWIAYGTAVQ